jgi:two-component system response regulator FixJ
MYQPLVHIVDDDASVRNSLALWLEFRGRAAREYPSAEAFLEAVDGTAQGCAIVDLQLGGMDGLALQAALGARSIALPLIFLTANGDVATARAALKAGAFDFLEKPVDRERLAGVIGEALMGDEERWNLRQAAQAVEQRLGRLTAREREVLEQVVAGLHNREIAVRLGISPRTVEVYKARFMDKLDVRRLPELVQLMARRG